MIFITGGTGFLGRHLVPALCKEHIPVRVLTRKPSANMWLNQYHNVEVIAGDLLDPNIIEGAIKGCEYVIHAGGIFRFWGDEHAFMTTNRNGTQNVIRAALNAGVKQLIHISTVAVIGDPILMVLLMKLIQLTPAMLINGVSGRLSKL
ncbi:MAG: NAD-dependent epimerase/dehydratase family protein [Anaerolineae bacterium]